MSDDVSYLRPRRIFRIWSFTANHNQLVMRSEPVDSGGEVTRAEVYFGNVQFVSMRPIHRGLYLRRPDAPRRAQFVSQFNLTPEQIDYTFVIDEMGLEFIVSGIPAWREAPRDFDDPSLFDFDQPWPPPADVAWGSL